jgi:SAM-dependent methyltransferase
VPSEDRQTHWQSTYAAKGEHAVSWFQDSPEPSLTLVQEVSTHVEALIDIGGGASRFVDALLHRGFHDLTVLDLSSSALEASRLRIGTDADHIQWIVADITRWQPPRAYGVWHDRAAFHFLVTEPDRNAYVSRLTQALKPGGHAIIATFAPDGPERCNGLPVIRYDGDTLGRTLGAALQLISTRRHDHMTPWGVPQAFQFSVFRRGPAR